MSGRKTFVGGDILLASEVNGFLMDQAVMVFDNASARTSAIPSPDEGMVTYLKDTDALEKRTASAWVSVDTPPRLLQFKTVSVSGLKSTNSTSYVSAGISLSITPKSSTSKLFVQWNFNARTDTTFAFNTRTLNFSLFNGASDVTQRRFEIVASRSSDNLKLTTSDHLVFVDSPAGAARTFTGRFKTAQSDYAAIVNSDGYPQTLTIMEVVDG
jgi:hypothetical protein